MLTQQPFCFIRSGGFMDMHYLTIRIEQGRVANYRVEQH